MIVFPYMLYSVSEKVGMKVPSDPDDFNVEDYPHFSVFCSIQLYRPLVSWGEHWDNAKVIANISDDKIKTITLDDLRSFGVVGI